MAGLEDAYRLMGPLTGSALAGVLFAVALLAAGQSSSITATLAGQVVMEGFVQLRVPAWCRRLATHHGRAADHRAGHSRLGSA